MPRFDVPRFLVASRLRRAMVRALDVFPWTPLGLWVGAGASLGLVYFAYAELDLVWLVLGYAALGLVGVSTLLVLLSALALLIVRRRHTRALSEGPQLFETGLARETGYALPSFVWVPWVRVRLGWVRPVGSAVSLVRRSFRNYESVAFGERGEHDRVVRRVVVEDVFGLSRLAFRFKETESFHVRPRLGALRRVPVLTSLAGGDDVPHPMGLEDGDRVDLRRYAPGDPARLIHWKAFARNRKLVVRIPERALTRSRRTVAYQIAGPEDDATAAAARVAVEQKAFGDEWIFGADGAPEGTQSVDEALTLITRSIRERERGGVDLAAFVRRAEQEGPAMLILFAPPRPGLWMEHVVALARCRAAPRGRGTQTGAGAGPFGGSGGLRVVIGVDGIDAAKKPPARGVRRSLRWLMRDGDLRAVSASDLAAVHARLRVAHCDVVVFDRSTGRVLAAQHWNRSLEQKSVARKAVA